MDGFIRIGQRGKVKILPYPVCDYVRTEDKVQIRCKNRALVSIPRGATTRHRCGEHVRVLSKVEKIDLLLATLNIKLGG
jgi:hypothetical protein